MSIEQQESVRAYLGDCAVKFEVTGGMRTVRDKWECFAWLAQFKKGAVCETFEYFTGIGCVKKSKFPKHSALHVERPEVPTSADLLYSLLSDAEAYTQPFHEWADNFGSDVDSIKARNTYDACVQTGLKMARLFTQEQREHLQELLQDY